MTMDNAGLGASRVMKTSVPLKYRTVVLSGLTVIHWFA